MAQHHNQQLSTSFVVLSIVRPKVKWVNPVVPTVAGPSKLLLAGIVPKLFELTCSYAWEDPFLDQECQEIGR